MITGFRAFSTGKQLAEAGGKAGTLAELYQAGFLVPDGFIIPCSAFDAQGLKGGHLHEVEAHFAALKAKSASGTVAVRSSSLQEDLREASHAGEFTSVLNVGDTDALHLAIQQVLGSGTGRHSTTRNGAASTMAVFVQEQIEPDYAGVMFTVDPVSGNTDRVIGNFVPGLADTLLAGDRDALTFTIDKRSGVYEGDAALEPLVKTLRDLALRLEQRSGMPVDIEWAVRAGQVFILQCRPVTGQTLVRDAWNDSLTGDYLWTNTNTGEAFNGTLTPLSATIMINTFRKHMGTLNGATAMGLIAGRLYLNLSCNLAIYRKLGVGDAEARRATAQVGGAIPDDITVPQLQIGTGEFLVFLARTLKQAISHRLHIKRVMRWLREECPSWCDGIAGKIDTCTSDRQVLALADAVYRSCDKLVPLLFMSMSLLSRQRLELEDMLAAQLSPDDAALLLSGLGQGAQLESLQPLLGFAALMRGEMSRADFTRRYGHRSALELELAAPRPAEDAAWFDALAAQWSQSAPEAQIRSQHAARQEIWRRLESAGAKKYGKLRKLYDSCSVLVRDREVMRSECTRMTWLMRKLVLKAAALHGLDDELFFLEGDELRDFLRGNTAGLAHVPARKRLYESYRRLPPFPNLISGAFRPFEWHADPGRRTDMFDSHRELPVSHAAVLKGFPGSAGVVEGRVRLLASPQQFAEFRDGEILVTSHTNIGWTLLFPRVLAIVTDIGAPLSHTAIIAREMGIPAVVGTGVATSRLKTGDKVRVNGGSGTVELLEPEPPS